MQKDISADLFSEKSQKEHLELMENRHAVEIASKKGDLALWIYDIETHKITQSFENNTGEGYPIVMGTDPAETIKEGGVHAEDVEIYRRMYSEIDGGAEQSECTVRFFNHEKHKFEWTRMILTRDDNIDGNSHIALGFSMNVNMQKIAETRYERENGLRKELVKDAVVYYRINLTNQMVEELYSEFMDTADIKLPISMDELVARGVFEGVYEPDQEMFHRMLSPVHMLANYNGGKMTETFLYRRELPGKGMHWLKGSISKLRRVSSDDVVAFFTAMDVDEEQNNQLMTRNIIGEEIENAALLNLYTNKIRIVARNHKMIEDSDFQNEAPKFISYNEYLQEVFIDVIGDDLDSLKDFINAETIKKSLEQESIIQHIFRIRTAEDDTRWKKIRVFYLDKSKHNIIFVQRDITDLYNEEERHRNELAEITNAAFMQHVYVQLENFKFYGNDTADKIDPQHSYEKLYEFMRGMMTSPDEYVVFDDFTSIKSLKNPIIIENKLESRKFAMKWPQKDGSKKDSIIEISRIFSRVKGEKIVSFLCRDVTEDVATLKAALLQAESASRAKGEFMSRMSHEIRTPLNAVIGYQDMVRDEMHDNQKIITLIDKSQTAAKHLLSVINDILDISSIETGNLKLEIKPFDMLELAHSIIVMFSEDAKSKGIKFEITTYGMETEFILGDSFRVKQILINIISNAVKFTPAGGSVKVDMRRIASRDDKVHVQFTIADTGIGMSREYMSRMYEVFEQESTYTTRSHGGTGLGLSISNNLINMMGGTINVESEQGRGSVFTIILAFDKYKEKHTDSGILKKMASLRCIVLDENTEECESIGNVLTNLKVKHDSISSAKKALRRIKSRMADHPYDFCIIDWDAPDSEPAETVKKIKEITEGKPPLIIAVSADSAALWDAADVSGVDGVLEKPLFASPLCDFLADIFGNRNTEDSYSDYDVNFDGMRVMLAEDNEMNMEISIDILTKAGMIITPVTNGKEAFETFSKSAEGFFDAIIMDVQMPVMDGYEATRAIRRCGHPQSETIPIIAMTANAFASDVTASLAAGMDDHVAKPINRKKLFDTLAKFR